jgi:hypothetical protein
MNGNRYYGHESREQNTVWVLAAPKLSRYHTLPTIRSPGLSSWAIIHGILGWLYVIYFALVRS